MNHLVIGRLIKFSICLGLALYLLFAEGVNAKTSAQCTSAYRQLASICTETSTQITESPQYKALQKLNAQRCKMSQDFKLSLGGLGQDNESRCEFEQNWVKSQREYFRFVFDSCKQAHKDCKTACGSGDTLNKCKHLLKSVADKHVSQVTRYMKIAGIYPKQKPVSAISLACKMAVTNSSKKQKRQGSKDAGVAILNNETPSQLTK